ncbi:Ionotropic receptor 133 [Diabrotica virgifera virgifera]|nr:Ionotropic receptor 133 [Diabrotica virgifera virgifera]
MGIFLQIIVLISVSTATIFEKVPTNNLEYLVNKLIESADCEKKTIYMADIPIRTVNYPVVSFGREPNAEYRFKFNVDFYVIGKNISDNLNALSKSLLLNSRSNFILVVDQISNIVLRMIDRYYIYKIVLLKVNQNKNYELCTLNTKKFAKPNIARSFVCNVMNETNNFENSMKFLQVDLFKKYYTKTFSRINIFCDFYPPYIISPEAGIHVNLLKIISSSLKLKVNFISSDRPTNPLWIPKEFETNHSYDMLATLTCNNQYDDMDVDKTVEITEDISIYLAPVIIREGFWNVLYGEYKTTVWVYFLLTMLMLYLAFYVVNKILKEDRNASTCLFLLGILFEGLFTSVKAKSKAFRALFVFYLIFVVVFTTCYKSKMFGIMSANNSYNIIETPFDLLKYKINRGLLRPVVDKQYFDNQDPMEQKLIESNVKVYCGRNIFNCIKRVAYAKDLFLALPLKIGQYFVSEMFFDSENKPTINIIKKEPTELMYFVFVFKKGHPLRDLFNRKITILKESGLTEYECRKYKLSYEKAMFKKKHDHSYYKPLDIESFQVIFYLYILCLIISIVTLCLEIITEKIKQNCNFCSLAVTLFRTSPL